MITLAGVRFEIGPDSALQHDDRKLISRFDQADAAGTGKTFKLQIVSTPPWSVDAQEFPDQKPVTLSWVAGRLRATHRLLIGEIDPFRRHGTLYRPTNDPAAIQMMLRAALGACLPLDGGLLLHSAAIVMDGRAFLFCGPSGAGKSTLTAAAVDPALSDELVAILGHEGFYASATGFWGTIDRTDAPRGMFRLGAVVELSKTSTFLVERLDARAALRPLIAVTVVPPGEELWTPALSILGRLTHEVPCYRMGWNGVDPPWTALRDAFNSQL